MRGKHSTALVQQAFLCIQLLTRSSLILIQVQQLSLFHSPCQDFTSLFFPACRWIIFTFSILYFANYSFSYFLEPCLSSGMREILQKLFFSAEGQVQTRIREDMKQGEAALPWSAHVVSSCSWPSAICVLNYRIAQVGKDL